MSRPRLGGPGPGSGAGILLALVIVLVFSAPLAQEGLRAPEPPVAARPPAGGPESEIVLQYSADRRITLNSHEVARDALADRLRALYAARRDRTLWFEGAGSLPYGEVVDVINVAKGAGVARVGVITPAMRNAGR